ncbi:MAG: ComEC/Rec2 family competence protein [Candidatus Delongbacteria bacterium]|nr:ComEC/Rec2 family competence protein [Candidatus Delongbacteria bacterium]MBN2836445.1 ComEC/Rec2 family competence protein [Candidatus Delongbacteria bacterium]
MDKWYISLIFFSLFLGYNVSFELLSAGFELNPLLILIVSIACLAIRKVRVVFIFFIIGFLNSSVHYMNDFRVYKSLKEQRIVNLKVRVKEVRELSTGVSINCFDLLNKVGVSFFLMHGDYKVGSDLVVSGTIKKFRKPVEYLERDLFRLNMIKGIVYTLDKVKIDEVGSFHRNIIEEFVSKSRDFLKKKILDSSARSTSNFLIGVLLGDKSGFENDELETFRKSGSAHLLAVSGLHVGFLILLFRLIPKRYPNSFHINNIIKSSIIIFYILLTGAAPSVVRAGLMIIFFYSSYYTDRVYKLYDLPALAGIFSIFFIKGSSLTAGFILSYLAIYGILISNELLTNCKSKIINKFTKPYFIGVSVFISLSFYIFNLFGFYNPLSIISGPLLVLLTGASMLFGTLASITHGLLFFGEMFSFYADRLVVFINKTNDFFASLTSFHIHYNTSSEEVLVFYSLLLSLFVVKRFRVLTISLAIILMFLSLKSIDYVSDYKFVEKGIYLHSHKIGIFKDLDNTRIDSVLKRFFSRRELSGTRFIFTGEIKASNEKILELLDNAKSDSIYIEKKYMVYSNLEEKIHIKHIPTNFNIISEKDEIVYRNDSLLVDNKFVYSFISRKEFQDL